MGSASSTASFGGLLPHPRVDTSFGPIEGKHILMPGGKNVASVFLGVPYAKPPIGPLRFKKPEMPEKWTQRVICRRYKPRSIQTRTPWDLVDVGFTDEDCLYLNIVGPAKFNEKYPNGYATMVYIHGGGFQMDCAAKYHYRNLVRLYCKNDIVVVTIEYRLGYLGFLCLDGKHCKGNFGIWDMVFALRFVHDNIRLFGGDPDNVTLFGQSAGAVSTALLSISPVSRDLFKQTICIAGFAHSIWSVNDIKFAVDNSRKKAVNLGFKRPNKVGLLGVRINRRMIIDLIESSYKQIQFWANIRGTEMPMTIETFKNIYGINDIMLNDKEKLKRTAVQMLSDFITNIALHSHCVKHLERNGTTCYRYLFEHFNRMITSAFNPYFPFVSSTHGTELPYLFNANIYISPWYKTKADLQVQDIITRMFANFAKSGDPNGDPAANDFKFKWDPISFEKPEAHLVIRAEPFMRESTGHLARIERLSVALELMMFGMGIGKIAFATALAVLSYGIYINVNKPVEKFHLEENGYFGKGSQKPDDTSIKPFKIAVSDAEIKDLKDRLKNARIGHEQLEDVPDFSYGFNLKTLLKYRDYWLNNFDWRKQEAILNSFPQFKTQIEGLQIHFLHVKPPTNKYKRVFPILLAHGWPGNIFEFYKMIPILTDPEKHGLGTEFAFEVIAPSIPGYGYSEASHKTGLNTASTARIFKKLMTDRLKIKKFFVQGGDWGTAIVSNLGRFFPNNVYGVHVNMIFAGQSAKTLFQQILGSFFPSLVFSHPNYATYSFKNEFLQMIRESGYFHLQATKPDTVGVSLNESPIGLLAYIGEKFSTWTNKQFVFLQDGGIERKFTKDEILTIVSIYWFNQNILASQRYYRENLAYSEILDLSKIYVNVPTGYAAFPNDLLTPAPIEIAKNHYNITHFNMYQDGGHFAAFEMPKYLAKDVFEFAKKQIH